MISLQHETDTLVVGGGIIGLSLAWELARRGKSVRVAERHAIGSRSNGASSWAGAGILPPAPRIAKDDPYEQLLTLSHQLHPQWAQKLRSETGIDTGFRKCGGIYLAATAGELATLVAQEGWWVENEIAYERLKPKDLLQLEPNLRQFCSAQFLGGWLLPDEWQLRNPRQLEALKRACVSLGVEIMEQVEVTDFLRSNGNVSGVQLASGECLTAGNYCVCNGAWARTYSRGSGTPMD